MVDENGISGDLYLFDRFTDRWARKPALEYRDRKTTFAELRAAVDAVASGLMDLGANPTREQEHAAMQHYGEKLAGNPSGLLIYHPPGAKALTPGQLATEFLTELLEALIVVFLLAHTRLTTFGSRVGFVTLVGVLAAITTNISYWNWYGFPANYTAAYMTIEMVGYLVVGIVAALVMKNSAPKTLVTTA